LEAIAGADELTDDEILERLGLAGDGLGANTDFESEDTGELGGGLASLLLSSSGTRGGDLKDREEISVEDVLEASGGVQPVRRRYTAVRLDNNKLQSIRGLTAALSLVCSDITAIRWLDLSHNEIDSDGLKGSHLDALPSLTTLHLHGNLIHRARSVTKSFGSLVQGDGCVQSLSLHGNPIKEAPYYRAWVIGLFSKLTRLDNVPVTRRERDYSSSWIQMHGKGGPGDVPAHVMETFGLAPDGTRLASKKPKTPTGKMSVGTPKASAASPGGGGS